jgi:hypothetical protein
MNSGILVRDDTLSYIVYVEIVVYGYKGELIRCCELSHVNVVRVWSPSIARSLIAYHQGNGSSGIRFTFLLFASSKIFLPT